MEGPRWSRIRFATTFQTEVEIRQVYEMAEFAPSDPTGEIRKKEQKLRETVEARRRQS